MAGWGASVLRDHAAARGGGRLPFGRNEQEIRAIPLMKETQHHLLYAYLY